MSMHKALVIEDDPSIRRDLVEVAQAMGMNVHQSESVEESTKLLTGEVYDLVLLDLGLRDHSGSDLIDLCRLLETPPIVIVVSSTMDISTRNHCLKLGARDFVSKPFHRGELTRRIDRAIREGRPRAMVRAGSLVLDDVTQILHVGSTRLGLSADESTVMSTLMSRPNSRFSIHEIERLSPPSGLESPRRLRRTIRRLVRKSRRLEAPCPFRLNRSRTGLSLNID